MHHETFACNFDILTTWPIAFKKLKLFGFRINLKNLNKILMFLHFFFKFSIFLKLFSISLNCLSLHKNCIHLH